MSLILVIFAAGQGQIANQNPDELRNIDVTERLGGHIPKNLRFTNDQGDSVALAKYFNRGKPVILVLAYYECPMLCTLVLNGLTQALYKLDMQLGKDYQILTVSIDPSETFELAASKKKAHLKMLDQSENTGGWIFFTGDETNINILADSIGFEYYYVEKRDEYAHPAVVTLLTENGKISRYLYGIDFKTNDLKLGLLEASEGKVGSTLDKLILYCYHYDPDSEGYVVLAYNVMKLGGAFTLVLLSGFIGFLWIRGNRKKS